MTRFALAIAAVLAACAHHDSTISTDAPAPPLDAPVAACTSSYAVGSGSAWCAVDAMLDQSLAGSAGTSQYPGYEFAVYQADATGAPVLRYSRVDGMIDGATADVATPVKTASAAKMIAALLVARAASYAGSAALSPATTIDVLGCSGLDPRLAGTTLDQLMHQIAGLDYQAENACVTSTKVALADCACSILQTNYVPAQAGSFAYTPHNFTVAIAMADAVLRAAPTPTDVRTLFADWIATLGIPSTEAMLTPTNDFAGGDHLSARAYAQLAALALPGPARGTYRGQTLLDSTMLDRMTTPFDDDVTITYSPYEAAVGFAMRYGFGDWVQCGAAWPEPATWPALDAPVVTLDYATCPYRAIDSLGKFGYMPWFTVGDRPYVAVMAVDLSGGSDASRVSANSFAAYEMLDPLLRTAIDDPSP